MSTALLGVRTHRLAVATVVATLALGAAGCGQTPDEVQGSADTVATVDVSGNLEPGSRPGDDADRSSEKKGKPAGEPSLPPGDPGLDAPAVPEPAPEAAGDHDEAPARRTVPRSAMLTADTVSMVLGGRWASHAGGGDECLRPENALGTRTTSYGGTDAGIVVESVATYPDSAAADAAVAALGRAATGCGWDGEGDPRLGSASVTASQPGRAMTAVSSEGVVVLLVGSGDVTRKAARWGSLVDLALGTSCPAAPDGCH